MIQIEQRTAPYHAVEAKALDPRNFEFAFASRPRKKRVVLQVPSGLVVSSENEIRRKLADVLLRCALTPVLASTVAESGMALVAHEMLIVVCNDRLDDGKYEDIVKLVSRSETQVPVILVSRTGDWPEYLAAMGGGAFDYLAYPPVPGDLQQTIQNALLGRQRHFEENGKEPWADYNGTR